MHKTAINQLKRLQQSLYDKAYKEAHSIVLGGASAAILSYSEKFELSLPKTFNTTTLASILEELRKKQFILYGDFHTLRQSQRGLLRLLRSYCERLRTNKIVIALEMFKARDQDCVDAYLAGRLSELELLENVNYQTEWGFPWPNFRMILDFARTHKIPVIGINTDNGGKDTLTVRDRFAAKRLCEAARLWPHHKIVCLIGEYHLADSHLPAALQREQKRRGLSTSLLRVVNNVDRYYFEMPRENAANSTEYLQLKRDFFCIMNSPPWMKWQSFSIWEEMRHVGLPTATVESDEYDIDNDLDLNTEDTFDVDYQFFHFVKHLALFLELKIDASDLESFHIYFSQDADFYHDLEGHDDLPAREIERLIERASADGFYFLSRSNTILLTHLSLNNLGEAAGQYLHRLLSQFNDQTGDQAADFLRRILKAAAGMTAGKILNPRRKCMELYHYRQILRRLKGRRLTGLAHSQRNKAMAVLKFDRWIQAQLAEMSTKPVLPPKTLILLDGKLNYELSRDLGQMLGFTLYKKIIAGKVPASRMRRLFKRRISSNDMLWQEVASLYKLLLNQPSR